MAVALAVVVGSELVSRGLVRNVGRGWEYWEPVAAAKFEFVRNSIEEGTPIHVLIIGDSTGAKDIDPRVIEATVGWRAWNAASSGNFPLAFEFTTLPLVRDSRLKTDLLILSFVPSGFTAGPTPVPSEAGIIGSAYVQRQISGPLTGDYSALARLKTAWPYLVGAAGRPLPASVRDYGFEPNSRQLPAEAPLPAERSGRRLAGLEPRRLLVLEEVITAAHAKGFVLCVVIPPSLTHDEYRISGAEDYATLLRRREASGELNLIDYRHTEFLTTEHFADINHLNSQGARILSADLGRRLMALMGKVGLPSLGR